MAIMIPVLAPPSQSGSSPGSGSSPTAGFSVILEAVEEKGFFIFMDINSFRDIQEFPYRSQGYSWLPKRIVDECGRRVEHLQLPRDIPRSPHD